ncbi:MAG: hypothetical protein QMD53_05845 [Actinomycetota bacterium]|nr:hypothetical protein [Actinomycetota bacterium]
MNSKSSVNRKVLIFLLIFLLFLGTGYALLAPFRGGTEVETETITSTDEEVDNNKEQEPEMTEEGSEPAAEKEEEVDGSSSSRHFGYIKGVSESAGNYTITVDFADFLTGDEAAGAATAHGDESPPPNDYYIVNDDMTTTNLPTSGISSVIMTTKSDGVEPEGYPVNFGVWFDTYIGMISGSEFVTDAPYWITLEAGVVTAIEEQYLP